MGGFDHFYHAFGFYWQRGDYWIYVIGLISLLYFCYKMGVIKSIVFHLIAFPLVLNRYWWMTDAYREHLRPADALPAAAFTFLVSVVLYVLFAFGLTKKDW